MDRVRDRIYEMRRVFNITQRQLAKRIGVTSQLISMIENEKVQLSHLTAKAIESEFGVSHDWLLYGEGDMMVKKPNQAKMPIISNDLTAVLCYYPNIANALNQFASKMTIADWEALNAFLSRGMQDKSKEHAEASGEKAEEE